MLRKKERTQALLILAAVVGLVLFAVLALFRGDLYYPYLRVATSDELETTFLFGGRKTAASCDTLVSNIENSILAVCPACRITEKKCLDALEPQHIRMLSAEPLDEASVRLPDGIVIYDGKNQRLTLAACNESVRQASIRNSNSGIVCYERMARRPLLPSERKPANGANWLLALLSLAVSGLVACLVCYLLIRYQEVHGHLTNDATSGGPQKFHALPTPRIGGVALLLGMLTTGACLVPLEKKFAIEEFSYLLLAALPAFAGGFGEDLTRKVGVLARLALTMFSALLGAWLVAAVLRHLDVAGIDALLPLAPIAIAFTVFAVGGVANSINIIDGYNGLVAGFSILVLTALAWVGAQVGDTFVMTAAFSMAGALLGFVGWNYPKGRIFLGDGGAYFLGFWLAELSVLLVVRHPEVSPWFPLVLLVYPVFETIFSIYRRKFLRGESPGHPDSLHLHQLIYLRLARVGVGSKDPNALTARNSFVAPYVWIGTALGISAGVLAWGHTEALILLALVFCGGYLWLYRRLVRWRAPRWMISSRPRSALTVENEE